MQHRPRANSFVVEGKVEIGPAKDYFTFLGGEYLGKILLDYFKIPDERGFSDLGRVRLTVERLDE